MYRDHVNHPLHLASTSVHGKNARQDWRPDTVSSGVCAHRFNVAFSWFLIVSVPSVLSFIQWNNWKEYGRPHRPLRNQNKTNLQHNSSNVVYCRMQMLGVKGDHMPGIYCYLKNTRNELKPIDIILIVRNICWNRILTIIQYCVVYSKQICVKHQQRILLSGLSNWKSVIRQPV